MNTGNREDCLSDLALDRIVADPRAHEIPGHLRSCKRCRERFDLFRAAQQKMGSLVERLTQAAAKQSTERKPSWVDGLRERFPSLILVAASSAALLFAIFHLSQPSDNADAIRVKGTSLKFFRQRGTEVTHGISGDTFIPGDALRFVVSSGTPGHFLLIGIESSGEVTAYYPYGGSRSAPLEVGTDVALPGSLVLDDSRGAEYFVGIFSEVPVELEEVKAAVNEARSSSIDVSDHGLSVPGTHHWIVVRKP